MLVFVAFGFAAQTNMEGDVSLTSTYKVNAMAAVAAGIENFDIGAKASAEVIRDLWVGSDFDQDGNKEVMLASYGTGGRVYVYEIDGDNNATLFFDTGDMGSGYTSATRHVAFGDLDGNGMQELLVSVNSGSGSVGGIWAFEYDTVGDSMRAPVQLFGALATADRWYCENFSVGDVDKDGVEEIFFGNNGSSSATDNFHIESVESGTFAEKNIVTKNEFMHGKTSATFPVGGSPYGGVMADLNGDGMNEVLFAPWDNGAMLIVENDSADSYTAVNYIETDLDVLDDFAFWDFEINDLDADGRDEAYLSMYSGGRLYVTTCPEGTELSAMTTANVSTLDDLGTSGGVSTEIGDLDGNGRMNIYASGGGSYITNHEFIGTDPTDSTHWTKMDNITSASFKGVYGMRYAGDLDGDGYDEIYAANTAASLIAASAVENVPYDAPAVFFSEYIEGSGNNKALEIYNGTDATIELDEYRIAQTNNGSDWKYWHTFPAGATLAAGDVWVLLNSDTDPLLVDFAVADEVLSYPSPVHHNGDDARAIEYSPAGDSLWYKADVIGWPSFDPGSAWDVAGTSGATKDHTLIRKTSVLVGNLDWAEAAGSTVENSEWEVYASNTLEYLGEHPTVPSVIDSADFFIPKGSHALGYVSLKAAVDSINANGVVGEINFILDADTLREESFTFAAALDADNNVTVKPAEGRDVVLIVTPGASKGNGAQMIGFNKGYVTFDGSNDGTDSRNLLVTTETNDARVPFGLNTADADNVTIKNLIIKNLDNVATNFKYGAVTNDVGGIKDWVVDNCQIGSAEAPVWRDGVAVWGAGSTPSQGIITNNEIYAGSRGIGTYILNDCDFSGNTIYLMPTTSATSYTYHLGIYITGNYGMTKIHNNKIFGLEKTSSASAYLAGIAFAGNQSSANDVISVENNMVNIGATDETRYTYGMCFRSTQFMGNINAYHNTFIINDNASTLPSLAIGERNSAVGGAGGGCDLDLQNNIIINNHTGSTASAAISMVDADLAISSDNNVITSDQNFATLLTNDYADLTAWQASGNDAGSVSKAVTFVAADDLHLAAPSDEDVDLAMPAIAGVDMDIDGDMRGAFIAYAGAEEGSAYPENDLNLTFDTDTDVANWTTAAAWDTKVQDAAREALKHVDGGWSASIKRPVKATVGSLYKLTAFVETDGWDAGTYDLSVSGLGNDDVKISAISEGAVTEISLIGVADAEDGFILFSGSYPGTKSVTLWIDSLVWDDQYMDITPSEDIAACRDLSSGEWTAVVGVVNNTTTGAPISMEDATAGIALYDWDFINNTDVRVGDEILVIGERSAYKGLEQLKNTDMNFQIISRDNVVEPTLITVPDLDSRDYQGMLVMVEDVDTVAGFAWPAEGYDASITATDGTNEFVIRIDKDSDIDGSVAPEAWPLNLIGVVSEYTVPQIMPRIVADFITNQAPGAFAWINPVDGDTVASMDDPALVDVVVAPGDTAKGLFTNWTEAVDEDTVVYEWVFIGEGPDDLPTSTDTFMVMPLNMDEPYEMNGTYNIAIKATDVMGKETMSDTIEFTFDFPAPPMVVSSDVVLIDGAPKYYVQFNMPVAAELADFKVLNWSATSVEAATAVAPITPCAVMVTAPLPEDAVVSLIVDGVSAPSETLSKIDTTNALTVLIPFSDAHPEDVAKIIQSFDTDVAPFKNPTWSGSTNGILDASSFVSSDSVVFRGTAAGMLTILDDPAVEGGWYVRDYAGLEKQVKANSTLLLLVKGVGDVEMRLSIKDSGYEQGPWKRVTLCENDWQVVSFDLANDVAEGWITGNSIVEGTTCLIEGIHLRSDSDEDVVLFLDEFTERQVLSPVDITLNVMMHEWLRRGDFNLVTNFVDVAGNFNGWGGTSTLLSDFDGDTTYSVTFEAMPYSRLEFKFRIDGSWNDLTAEFPYNGPARTISVRDYDRSYTYWYNNDTLQDVSVNDIPVEFALRQNYPNPFNPTTMIEFDLPEAADVSLVIYDITGRQIRTLVSEAVDAGYKGITWNGRDNMGNGVATGMYIYRLQAGDFVDVKKMTFMK
mgnify:CR=1 FL=1